MFNVILFGPPGSGKGTQSKKIMEKYGLTHLSTGDLLRTEIANRTPLGKEAHIFIDRGQLVPDEIVIGMIGSVMESNKNKKGFLFDGYPRTVAQAEALDKLMKLNNTSINVSILLDVNEDELIARLLKRGETSKRTDDVNEDIIRRRIVEYKNKTAPVADYYRSQNKIKTIKGVGEVEEIFAAISQTIDLLQNSKLEA